MSYSDTEMLVEDNVMSAVSPSLPEKIPKSHMISLWHL